MAYNRFFFMLYKLPLVQITQRAFIYKFVVIAALDAAKLTAPTAYCSLMADGG